ncbi:MAG: esterase [Clostridia bacterium]|nr:esterase [Clostridia bacterium]
MIHTFGDPASSKWILIQPVDEHDLELMQGETAQIRARCPNQSFSVLAIETDWFKDLAPWKAKSAFKGQPDFGDGAGAFLQSILNTIGSPSPDRRYILGGYSLAGLFALWAGYQTDAFDGIAAASPSVWYPGWIEYAEKTQCSVPLVYLSLGDKEERTRNPVMKTVGDNIRKQQELLMEQGVNTTLEWNPGNHFVDSDKRTAAGFAWIMENTAPIFDSAEFRINRKQRTQTMKPDRRQWKGEEQDDLGQIHGGLSAAGGRRIR